MRFFRKNRKETDARQDPKTQLPEQEKEKVGASDLFAMLISAFLTFLPICILIVVAISLLMLWLFKAL